MTTSTTTTTTTAATALAISCPEHMGQKEILLSSKEQEFNCFRADTTSTLSLLMDEEEEDAFLLEHAQEGRSAASPTRSAERASCCEDASTADPVATTPTRNQLEPEASLRRSRADKMKREESKLVEGEENSCSSTASLEDELETPEDELEFVAAKPLQADSSTSDASKTSQALGKHTLELPPPAQINDTNNSSSPAARSDPSGNVKASKSVSFSDIHIREYGIILGDHPETITGPAITVDWQPFQSYRFPLDDYEAQLEGTTGVRRRTPAELRMPSEVRHSMVMSAATFAAQDDQKLIRKYQEQCTKEMEQAMLQGRKIRHQRRMSSALYECDLEAVQVVYQSAMRKVVRFWKHKRQQVEDDPAAAWLQQHKQQQQAQQKGGGSSKAAPRRGENAATTTADATAARP